MADAIQHDVFLSHSAQDKPVVRKLAGRFATCGAAVRALGVCACLLFLSVKAAVVQEVWVTRYDAPVFGATDFAEKIVRDGNGDIIVTGTTGEGDAAIVTIKYSGADGSVLWSARYNGSRHDDTPQALAVDASGNVMVAGYTYEEPFFNRDCYTAKYAAATGALLWERRFSGAAHFNDEIAAMTLDSNGDVLVTGFTETSYSKVFTAKYSAANGAVLWQKIHGGFNSDYGRAIAVDANGDVLVTGYTYNGNGDYLTVKYAGASGDILWQKAFNGSGNSLDQSSALAVDHSGNVFVTGASTGPGGNFDFCTIKYAGSNGSPLWTNRYNGPANLDDQPTALALDANGNPIVTGFSRNATNDDCYTAKYAAATGVLLWEQRYNSPSNHIDQAHALSVDSSGNVIIAGQTFSLSGNSDYYTAKYAAADGGKLWEVRYDGVSHSYDKATSLTLDSNGDAIVTGRSYNGLNNDYYTARYAAANGALLWEKRFDGPVNRTDIAQAVAIDAAGNVIVTGYSYTNKLDSLETDYYTAKYAAADGALLWERRYTGPGYDYDFANDLALDSLGNVIVTGSSWNETNGTTDIYTAKYAAADGTLLWEKRFDGPSNSYEIARAVALDNNGDVIVTGNSGGKGYTAKYAAANGALLWAAPAIHPEFGFVLAYDVALDMAGNVFVTGYSQIQSSFGVCYTAKYANTNGALLWEKRSQSYGEGRAVCVDPDGNAVMTGTISSNSANFYYTAKYAGANGALLWEKIFSQRTNGSDTARALAVDAQGNAFVTGTSYTTTNADFYTIKYSGTNGAVLWARRFNGPANLDDSAKSIALDAAGNVVVAGTSLNGPSSTDYSTIKYSGTDGALLWAKYYNGPANREDTLVDRTSLATGPGGRVAVAGGSQGRNSSVGYDYATILYREFDFLPAVTSRRSGNLIQLSWPASHQGWWLQTQTNQPGLGLTTNWITIANSASTNVVVLSVNPAHGSIFLRLVHP